MEGGLLVDGSEDGGLLRLGGVERGGEVEFETLGDLVLELELRAEQVGGGPCLGVSKGKVKTGCEVCWVRVPATSLAMPRTVIAKGGWS